MRISRSILLPVAMNALWGFSAFTSKAHPPNTALSLASFVMLLTTVILILAAVIWSLGKKRQTVLS